MTTSDKAFVLLVVLIGIAIIFATWWLIDSFIDNRKKREKDIASGTYVPTLAKLLSDQVRRFDQAAKDFDGQADDEAERAKQSRFDAKRARDLADDIRRLQP